MAKKERRVFIPASEKSSKGNNQYSNKRTNEYMSLPEVRKFNDAIKKKAFTCGHNKIGIDLLNDMDKLQKELVDFFNLCDETNTIPTVTSCALYLGLDKTTIYFHANNPNSPVCIEMKNLINYCHSALENGTVYGKVNPVAYIFMSKNYFGMKDDRQLSVTTDRRQTILIDSTETMDAIKRQIEVEEKKMLKGSPKK